MPNAYLQKQAQFHRQLVSETKHTIEQLCVDTVELCLHREYGWGYNEIIEFSHKWAEYYNHYFGALERPKNKLEDERDVYRTHMDEAFLEILGDRPLIPFKERYPYAESVDYGSGV